MRWATYESADGTEHCGVVIDQRLHGSSTGVTLLDVLRSEGGLRAAGEQLASRPDRVDDLSSVTLRAPVPTPPSIRDFASFERHVSGAGKAAVGDGTVAPVWYQHPVFYFSSPAAVLGPLDSVPIAPGSVEWDYEIEVAAVMGRPGSDLSAESAEDHIAGYMTYCDWSARDISLDEFGFVYGPSKSKDGATSFGPFLVTPDELAPYRSAKGYALDMTAEVNGNSYGGGRWDELHWSFGDMLAHASRGTTLRVGDVLTSGAVGTGCILEMSHEKPYLQPGDQVRVDVEQLGSITARIETSR